MAEVTFVHGDYWMGLYADGELVREDHRIPADDALSYFVNAHIEKVESFWVKDEWLNDQGNLPAKLSDIPKEAIEY